MTQSILQGTLVALHIFLASPTPTQPPLTTNQPLQDAIREVKYVVKEGDTLASISQEQYGYEDYWVNILNDNDWIYDPDALEEGSEIKIRTTPPLLVDEYVRDISNLEQVAGDFDEVKDQSATKVLPVTPTIQPTAVPTASVQAATRPGATGPLNEAQMDFLGRCESGMTATRNSGNGYYGAFQFSIGTWNSMGTGYERADMAPLEVQKDAVQRLLQRSSIWTQFPGCAQKMRANGLI